MVATINHACAFPKKEKRKERRKETIRKIKKGGKFYDYTRLYCPREPGHQPCLLIAIVYDFHSKRYASVSSRITRPPSPHAHFFTNTNSSIKLKARGPQCTLENQFALVSLSLSLSPSFSLERLSNRGNGLRVRG